MYRPLKDGLSNYYLQIRSDALWNATGRKIRSLMEEKDLGKVIQNLQYPDEWKYVLSRRVMNEDFPKY